MPHSRSDGDDLMQVFAVFAVRDPARVQQGLDEHYPNQYRVVGNSAYLLATKDETTREVATKLGLGDEMQGRTLTSGLIVPVISYWGRGDRDMWEWIAVRQRSDG